MFPWSTVHVMNAYVDHGCICEDDTDIPKENVPPPLPVIYPKKYPTMVNWLIGYTNTSHFIILFVYIVHSL